jgi:hypothetical protein
MVAVVVLLVILLRGGAGATLGGGLPGEHPLQPLCDVVGYRRAPNSGALVSRRVRVILPLDTLLAHERAGTKGDEC